MFVSRFGIGLLYMCHGLFAQIRKIICILRRRRRIKSADQSATLESNYDLGETVSALTPITCRFSHKRAVSIVVYVFSCSAESVNTFSFKGLHIQQRTMVKLEKISHAVKQALHSFLSHRSSDSETSSIIESDFEHEKYKDKLGKLNTDIFIF